MLTVKHKQITNNTDDYTMFVNYTVWNIEKNNIDIFFLQINIFNILHFYISQNLQFWLIVFYFIILLLSSQTKVQQIILQTEFPQM